MAVSKGGDPALEKRKQKIRLQVGDDVAGQRDGMRAPGLHLAFRDFPDAFAEVEFVPLGARGALFF